MVKTVELKLTIPTDRILNISLPPDIPTGLVDLVLVIAPSAETQQPSVPNITNIGRDLLLTMPSRAALPFPDEPTDVAANHDTYLYGAL